MKIVLTFFLLFITWIIIVEKLEHNKPNVQHYKQGQILLPDYVCIDTLIVIDAKGLNKATALIKQLNSDSLWVDEQYDSMIHVYCIIKP